MNEAKTEIAKPLFVIGRAKESGRLWVYPAEVWAQIDNRNSMFDEVIRSDDYEALLQMAKLSNKEIDNELFADRDRASRR